MKIPMRGPAVLLASIALTSPIAHAATDSSGELQEVVVTAQKRSESLQNVPLSITAFSAADLETRAVKDFFDYATTVPNLGFGATGDGSANSRTISIRGVSGDNTTGFYLDETPLPDSLDPHILDIERIEVLRGPQGTLYGARSMGGTVRLITKQPDLSTFSASLHGGISTTDGTVNPNYVGDGTVNLPIVQNRLAVRANGFYDREAGFFSRRWPTVPGGSTYTTLRDIGRNEISGGELSLLWKPTDAMSVTTRVLHQESNYNGLPTADATPDNLNPTNFVQTRLFNVPEGGSDRWTLYSLGIKYETSIGEIVSSTSYFDRLVVEREDQSDFVSLVFFPDAPVASQITEIKPLHRFVQEVRFASTLKGPVQFVAGVYLSESNGQFSPGLYPPNSIPGLGAVVGAPTDLFFYQNYPSTIREPAVFGEVSFQATEKLKLTAGARWYEIKTRSGGIESGAAAGTDLIDPPTTLTNVGVNPKVQADYKITPNAMVYATAARGFRPGGIVPSVPLNPLFGCDQNLADIGITPTEAHRYKPDSLWNYELGSKTSWFDNHLTVDGAVFYIDWKDLQQQILLPCGFQFRANVGAAKSQGAELEVHARPVHGLDLSGGLGYQKAEITKASSGGAVSPQHVGDRVYQVPDWTGNFSVTYSHELNAKYSAVYNLTYGYMGSSKSANNDPFNPRTRAPYSIIDARVGVSFGAWDVSLVGKNLTNEHANLADNRSIAVEMPGRPRIVTNQPLTVGIDVRRTF
jgi:outer membrane receptor protein involved in Fe transport